jgi:hypothetical protein
LEQSGALNAIRQIGGAQVHSHQLVVGLHIQLKEKPRREVTAPLLSPLASELLDGKADFPGIILSREEASVIIDASVAYANALFVRIARKHPPEVPFEELAQALRNDERRIFDVLGLEGDL